ncbi:MAG: aminopeptidase P family protein [Beutenbergiaceae bacterium]
MSHSSDHRSAAEPQPLDERGTNRSRRPNSPAFRQFMASQWAEPLSEPTARAKVADFTQARRAAMSALFPRECLIIPAGGLKVRSNDTDYRFRPHSAFAHLTGLGTDEEPDAVLVLHPIDGGHQPTVYLRPLATRDCEEFYADPRRGEFWVGSRPTLPQISERIGIRTAHLDELTNAIAKDAAATTIRVVTDADQQVTNTIDAIRGAFEENGERDAELAQALSELRLVKDAWEIEQLRAAVAASVTGFADVIQALPRAQAHSRGERVIEAAFGARARTDGNGVGYDTIAAAGDHATTLHWIRNDGAVRAGDLLLLDAGVELDSLYTADITRTIPVNGTFTDVQRMVYHAVLDAADAAFAIAKPGVRFRALHEAAMEVLADRLHAWGLLPVPAAVALRDGGQHHRRWMPHGTSHHLGLDVHDCAAARASMYLEAHLQPGMIFTIEPGLYFKADDLAVPEEFRGIGVRIEDDVLVTADGVENLSAALPRSAQGIEAWMASLTA